MRIWHPLEAAELPDDGSIEWAPVAPYWAVLWRSGVALARELAGVDLHGRRVIELGCGLGLPSIVAARNGADVLATDMDSEALELLSHNARENGVAVETAVAEWSAAEEIVRRGPFDLVIGADVLYEPKSMEPLISLLPSLAPEAWVVDPGRPASHLFIEQAEPGWEVRTERRGVVSVYRLRLVPFASSSRREPGGGVEA